MLGIAMRYVKRYISRYISAVPLLIVIIMSLSSNIGIYKIDAQTRLPVVREPRYDLANISVDPYKGLAARGQRAVPISPSIFADMISLDLETPSRVVNVSYNDSDAFMLIDGASQSLVIGVRYRISIPNGSTWEFETLANKPFHLLIEKPPKGIYTIYISTINPGNTTAWLQITSPSMGASYVDTIEKEYLYLAAGQAKYLRISISSGEWVYIYGSRKAGSSAYFLLISLRTLETSLLGTDEAERLLLGGLDIEPGEYVLGIVNSGHTDILITVAKPGSIEYILRLNEGIYINFSLESDVEIFWLDVSNNASWLSVDATLISERGWGRILVYDPNISNVFQGYLERYSLINKIVNINKHGRYLVIVRGIGYPIIALKFCDSNAAIDMGGLEGVSLNISFKGPGSSIYLRFSGDRPALAVAISQMNQYYRISLISQDGVEMESSSQTPVYMVGSTSKVRGPYYIRVQSLEGWILLHYRVKEYADYNIRTPDYSDLSFRFPGDIIMIAIALRSPRYLAQLIAPLNSGAESFFWVFDESLNSKYFSSSKYQPVFLMLRAGKDIASSATGTSFFVALSLAPGRNLRVSTLQDGDESEKASTPYHRIHGFDFDYQLKIIKINIPSSRWVSATTYSLADAPTILSFYNKEIEMIDRHVHMSRSDLVKSTIKENIEAGPWIIALEGLKSSNVSISIVTEEDLMRGFGSGVPTVIKEVSTYTLTVTATSPRCEVITYTVTATSRDMTTIATYAYTVTTTNYIMVPAGTEYKTITLAIATPQGSGDMLLPITLTLAAIIAILLILSYLRRKREG
jgi:hypothetical protein